nr:c-type lectin domain containing protein [Theama mediterranea]
MSFVWLIALCITSTFAGSNVRKNESAETNRYADNLIDDLIGLVRSLFLDINSVKKPIMKQGEATKDLKAIHCPAPWIKVGQLCVHYFHGESKTWNDSKKACAENGAELATFRNKKEFKAVTGIMNIPLDVTWIGVWVDLRFLHPTNTYLDPTLANDFLRYKNRCFTIGKMLDENKYFFKSEPCDSNSQYLCIRRPHIISTEIPVVSTDSS